MSRACLLLAVMCCAVSFGCRPAETDVATESSAANPAADGTRLPDAKHAKPAATNPDTNQTSPVEPKLAQAELTKPTGTAGPLVDWTQFRGPAMLATDPNATVPIKWNAEQGVLWKVPVVAGVKSRGASSPIVAGDRLFLTAYTGCGTTAQNRDKLAELQHHVICLDKHTGKPIWQRTIQGSFANKRLSEHAFGHGYASSTPIVDGNRLYTFFGVSGVFAFDLDGNLLWQTDVGSQSYDFGSSASLSVFEDLVLVNASIESTALYALTSSTGDFVWKRDGVVRSWCAPVVAEPQPGQHELILNQEDTVLGLNPRTGDELWRCDGIHDYVVATPIVIDETCYLTGGQEHQCLAIKLGGRGDVTETHKLWQVRGGSNVSSPSYHDGGIYVISSNGIMRCLDSETGKDRFRQRMGIPKQILASPTLLGDHLFVPTQYMGVVVMNLADDCKIVSRNVFAEDDVPLQASIAESENRMFLRTDDYVYCVGQPDKWSETAGQLAATTYEEVIIPKPKYDIDEKTGRPKIFVRCLVTGQNEILDFMLLPYKSVITPEQTEKSTEYILANHQPFIDLRSQYLDLKWEYMTGKKPEKEFLEELAVLEEATMQHNYKVRKFIKDMFSEEQMDQHLRENGLIRKKTK
jgi:outer membrane protein assembly factor BamB